MALSLLGAIFPADALASSATAVLFANGNEMTPGSLNSTRINALRASGFNTLVIFLMSVDANGNFIQSGQIICSNGVYTGDSTWGTSLAQCRVAPTGVTRLEMSIGGWLDQSFVNIKNRVAADGTNSTTVLYSNLAALKNALGLDAIDYDDEYQYDSGSAILFGKMCAYVGMKVSLCPYTASSYWQAVKSGLGADCDAVYLQEYEGGAGNNPTTWNVYFGGLKVMPLYWDSERDNTFKLKMQSWKSSGCPGGCLWPSCSGCTPPADAAELKDYASVIHVVLDTNLAYWQGLTADFNSGPNWSTLSVPVSPTGAVNDSGSNNLVQINAGDPTWKINNLWAGDGANAKGAFVQNGSTVTVGTVDGWFRLGDYAGAVGYYTLNGGTLNSTNHFKVGETGTGVLTVNGGTINVSPNGVFTVGEQSASGFVVQTNGTVNADQLWVGQIGTGNYTLAGGTLNVHNWAVIGRAGGNGTFNMTGGTFNKDTAGSLLVGTGFGGGSAVATFNHSGGTINCVNQFLVPEQSTCTGTYNISSNAVLICNNWIAVGRNGGIGTLNMSGGTISKSSGNSDHFDIGAGGAGTLNQSGGLITNTTSDFWLGEFSSATWNMNGGTALLGKLLIGVNSGVPATNNLNGGVQSVTQVTTGNAGATSVLNFNGGTLRAAAASTIFVTGLTQAKVFPGGAVLDSSNFNITVPQKLTDAGGGLTKLGTGNLTLSTANTLSGAIFVRSGALILPAGAGLTNASYCSVGQSGSDNGTMALQIGGSFNTASDLNIGDVGGSIGTLNMLVTANCTANAMFVGSANANNSTATGTVNHTNGTLVTTSIGDPAFCLGGRNAGSSLGVGTYNFYSGALTLKNGGNAWIGGYGHGTMKMTGGIAILSGYVSIGRQAGGVGELTVSGGAFNQTNTSRFLIVGENGSGTLTISNVGQVTVSGATGLRLAHAAGGAGVVNLGNGAPGGTLVVPAITIGAGSSATFNFNGGTLKANASSPAFMSGLTSANVLSGGAYIDDSGFAITVSQPLLDGGGAGGLTKNGLGTTTLNGANTFTGPTAINAGTLALGVNGSLATSSLIAVRSGATFDHSANPSFQLDAGQTMTGSGLVSGGLKTSAGSVLSPGDAIGTLTVQGDVDLSGQLFMELDRSVAQNCDQLVSVGGTISGGGTLTVTNLGTALQVSDNFQLFTQPVNGFATSLPDVSPYGWANNLAINGTLTVVSIDPPNLDIQNSTGSVTLIWPADHTGWQLQSQTNSLAEGLGTNWTTVAESVTTNRLSFPIESANGSVFYRLVWSP